MTILKFYRYKVYLNKIKMKFLLNVTIHSDLKIYRIQFYIIFNSLLKICRKIVEIRYSFQKY